MSMNRIQGLVFILLGIISSYDSWRISDSVRPTANFDGVGPDRYLAILSGLMIVLGLALALRAPAGGQADDWSELRRWPPPDYLVVAVILGLFIWAIPVIGFTFGSLLFFTAMYRFLGKTSWLRTVSYAVVSTAILYVIFIHFADMSLPKSYLGV